MRALASALVAILFTASAAVAQVLPDSLARLVAAGDAAWERSDHPAAFAAYDAVVRVDTAFSTRALFRLASLHAWSDRLDASIACHRAYVRLEPGDLEGRVALGRTLAWASKFAASIFEFDSVLAVDPDYRDASLGKAMTLAWWGKFAEALVIYDGLATSGDALEARKGRARVLAWRGDLGLAEEEWSAITREHPRDASAWVGLAQVLRWSGRAFAAEDALERALAITPDDRDAREQLRWVRVETKPQVSMTLLWAEDSEDNTLFATETRGAIATAANLRVSGTVREKWVGSTALTTVSVESFSLALAWQPGAGAWTYAAELGAAQIPNISVRGPAELTGGIRATGRLNSRLRMSAGLTREIFDEVSSALDAQVTYRGADVDLGYAATRRLSFGIATSVGATHSRSNANDRRTMLGSARYSFSRGIGVALVHREVTWFEPEYGVFFAPQRFALTEGSFSWTRPGELGLVLGTDVGVGAQSVRFESNPAATRLVPRGALTIGWRPVPGRDLIARFVHASVAGAGAITASEYRYSAVSLTARWTF